MIYKYWFCCFSLEEEVAVVNYVSLDVKLVHEVASHLHGFLAELLRETRAQDAQELFDAYLTRRDVEDEQVEPLMEIIRACMARREGRA